ncbi:hypothetical protein ROJ8625_01504 [Roseivivax jejudonensis]|uniref:Uncharacterized protein n=1 Tax=Roseivivax jejudonensis TaxID=1529041 RepID=A0A1X6YXV9_9RHOB|nr:hypothetical protein [Roseivivax jejudonensis]SLN32538.1 hypothetical protein ROJ8625_01504 [Roseivivax jejudonensis]
MSAESKIWIVSGLVSAVLAWILFTLWSIMNQFEGDPTQLAGPDAVHAYFDEMNVAPAFEIATGVYVQSLEFEGATDVRASGYIWQFYQDGVHDEVKPPPGEAGFILPERVNAGDGVIEEAYRLRRSDGELIGWYFEQTLRQSFDYTAYPFDHKTVWIRMWPNSYGRQVVLTPDFDAYPATGAEDIFGIDERIVLGTWERENTYFDYKPSDLNTSLGLDRSPMQAGFPELHYNVVVKRKFGNAFIVHMVPLFVVATLLFGALMTVTRKEDLAARHDFSTSTVIETASVLFFVVLLAHVQLRESIAGSEVIYMEYFYFLMYFLLLGVSVNTYWFVSDMLPWARVIHYRDNLIPKAAFWPAVLAAMIAITLYNMAILI